MQSRKGPSRDPADDQRGSRAIAELRRIERDVLVLSAGYGLRNEEIAKRLGISVPRAERILARALLKFDAALEP